MIRLSVLIFLLSFFNSFFGKELSFDAEVEQYNLNDYCYVYEDKAGNKELEEVQNNHIAVLKLSVGKRDLQQCADAVMRLRGEHLFKQKKYHQINFQLANGQSASFEQYKNGYRPVLNGNIFQWKQTAKADSGYSCFMQYMNFVFSWANTSSLHNSTKAILIKDIKPGDFFVQKGLPYGHAMIVMDVIKNDAGEKQFMLAQSYMPAQDVHVVINPNSHNSSPWYSCTKTIKTPDWEFEASDLRRFM